MTKKAAISLSDHFTAGRLLRFALPTILMMIVTTTYSIVDGFFISNFVGKTEFAAVNLIMPFLMGVAAIGLLFGTGGSARIAYLLGKHDKKQAESTFSTILILIVITAVVCGVLGFIFMRPIAKLLGAKGKLVRWSVIYGRILICLMPFYMLQNAFQSLLVTAEMPKMGLVSSVIAGLTNVVLDFLFVYIFGIGLPGAAIATVLSWVVGTVVPLICFCQNRKKAAFSYGKPGISGREIRRIVLNGSPEMVGDLSVSIVSVLYNRQLMHIAGENGVAAYGVIMYVSYIFIAVYMGYGISTSPIVGYHYGAGHSEELHGLLTKSLRIIGIMGILMLAAGEFLARPMAMIFVGYDKPLCDMTTQAMQIYSISYLICGINIYTSSFFTGLNNGIISAAVSFLRTLVFEVIAVLLLPVFFGINGIWSAITVAEVATLIVSVILLMAKRHVYHY